MIRIFLGTNSEKARAALHAAEKGGGRVVRLFDVSTVADVEAALGSGGIFAEKKTVVLDRLSSNEELWVRVLDALEHMNQSSDTYLIYEEKIDAATQRRFEKNAAKIEIFELPKKTKERSNVFALANYLRAADKKKLWIAYQEELAAGNVPEAMHGILFWGAKQMLLSARTETEKKRSRGLVADLAVLPHEARRRGEELEYALERFVLAQ